jgi:hypothetical protein
MPASTVGESESESKHHVETLVKPKRTQVIMWNMMMQSKHHVESFGERESKPCKQRTCKQRKRKQKRKRKRKQASTVGESESESKASCGNFGETEANASDHVEHDDAKPASCGEFWRTRKQTMQTTDMQTAKAKAKAKALASINRWRKRNRSKHHVQQLLKRNANAKSCGT